MTAKRLIAGVLSTTLCFVSVGARADAAGLDRWHDLTASASNVFGIPESWISSVMRAESAGQQTLGGKPTTSTAGAMGLMQIMPETWAGLRTRYGLGNNPYDPHDNVFAGAAYLRELYQRYGYPNLFAAYNAGPRRLDSFLDRAEQLPDETWLYLAKLGVQSHIARPAGGQLFFALTHEGLEHAGPAAERLFMPLRAVPGFP